MGYYINAPDIPSTGKASALISKYGAVRIDPPLEWKEGIVCVVENGMFDAAAYCFSQAEMDEFKSYVGRKKTWLFVPDADKLSGYKTK